MTTMLIILALAIGLFVWGKLSPDVVALLSTLALYFSGILTVSEALSGFSNNTVVMIAALFVVGEGMSQTGWTAIAGKRFIDWAGSSANRLLAIIMLGVGSLSGFVSNTGTVATLMPATVAAAWQIGTFPSKVLMPMAFAANTGGLLTLTGTPPNIIVSNMLVEHGHAGFHFFEFGLVGLPLLAVAVLYFYFIGRKLLPKHKTNNRPIDPKETVHNWIAAYQFDEGYYRLRIRSASPFINTRIADWPFDELGISIVRLKRRHPKPLQGKKPYIEFPKPDTVMEYHDIITVKGDTESINRLMLEHRLGLLPLEPIEDELRQNLINREVGMAELVVTPKSDWIGRDIFVGKYFQRYDIQLLAVSRNNKILKERPVHVQAGDAFLVRGSWQDIEELQSQHKNMVVCGSPEGMAKTVAQLNGKSYLALTALLMMIGLMAFDVVPGVIAAMLAAGFTLLSGCVNVAQAYRSIGWVSVVMIGAMIPMGLAMQKTGLAEAAAQGLVASLGSVSPLLLLGGVFLLTTALSQIISNSATAVLMAPIAIGAALQLGASPEPFMIVVAISASTAFLTPIGTTTNAMVLSAGGYKFLDYTKAGGGLLLLFFCITMVLVPLIWPF